MKKAKLLALLASICLVLILGASSFGCTGPAGATGSPGPAGSAGPPGSAGPAGPAGESALTLIEAEIPHDGDVPLAPPSVRPVLIMSGSDYDMGYQYTTQITKIFGPWILERKQQGTFTEEKLAQLKEKEEYIQQYTPEFIDFMKGMADGATDAGVELSYEEVLADYTAVKADTGGCSSFIAFGSATKDGKLIFAASPDSQSRLDDAIIMFFPETGNNFMTDNRAGGVMFGGMNNKGVTYAHHGAGVTFGGRPTQIPSYFCTLHSLRFANTALEAKEMQLAYPNPRTKGIWGDVYGNVFVMEMKDPVTIRYPGDNGERDFIFSTNNTLNPALGMYMGDIYGLTWDINLGFFGEPGDIYSNARNAGMWNLLDNYHGLVDLEFAKMMYRFPAPQPDYPTLEEADAAYSAEQGKGWNAKIGNLSNSMVVVGIPDDGDEGLYYVSQGCATRYGQPAGPGSHFYVPYTTYSFVELKLASSPRKGTEAARARAQYNLYDAHVELNKLDYWDPPYAPLLAIFNQAATEWNKGEYYMEEAKLTEGTESVLLWGKSLRAFTRCQALAKQVYNSLIPPPDTPEDLGLREFGGAWGEWVLVPWEREELVPWDRAEWVTEEEWVLPTEVVALPPIELNIWGGNIQLIGDDLAPYGPGLISPQKAPWTITVKKGSTITITVSVSAHPGTGDHHYIIEGTTVDVYVAEGEKAGPFEVTFNEVGTFKVYCKLHPGCIGGEIVVME